MAEQQTVDNNNLDRDGKIKSSVDLIFPLQTEVTIELNKLPSYIEKLNKLFDFYEKQLVLKNEQIKGYNLKSEIAGLNSFLLNLQLAIIASKQIKPLIATDQEKTAITDYEILTIKIIDGLLETNSALKPISWDNRNFSDGSRKEVFIYDRIDTVYLTNKTFARSMAVFTPLQTTAFGINPSTLSLIFNIKQIVEQQINSPVPTDLLLCAGKETTLSRFEDGFSLFGFDVSVLNSKVVVQDFLNAYVHPQKEIGQAPRLTKQKGCNQQVKDRISLLRSNITLYNLQNAIAGEDPFGDFATREKNSKDKKELIELTKLCPELASEIAPFEKIKELEKLGKLFTDFLERFNLACIVDEAIKCIMPQIPCEQILRDISVDNFETRLKIAFPFAQQVIGVISNNLKNALEEEKKKREEAGNPELTIDEQSQLILDTINLVIDIEALCKLDLKAIAELIESFFNLKLPQFNMFDWQFSLKIDFQTAIIEALLRSLIDLISQILNQLIGCNSLDALVAGIIGNNIQADSGLYGDLAAIFGGDFDLNNSNTAGILGNSLNNFLSQSSQQLANIIKFETKIGNNFLGTINLGGNVGLGTSIDGIIAGQTTTSYDRFGGLVSVTRTDTGSVGLAGLDTRTQIVAEFDATKLASTEGQLGLLKEIGKFQSTTTEQGTTYTRISDDSVVNILNSPAPVIQAGSPSTITQASTAQTTEQNIFAVYGLRDTNQNIINALGVLNNKENRSTLYITQDSLGQQLKDYIKTCFAILSPSEVIELISGSPSQEIKLTITGISKVRFPLLNSILIYPDRHAALFASFGAITGLDSLSIRLQILASTPGIKEKAVDPNVCAPFTNIYDFREGLMNQVLPPDLANNLINNIIEDNRQKANKLIESLAKGLQTLPAATNPNLFINKTADGKPIQEIDEVVDNVLDSILDQVKITFDEDIDSFPAATEATRPDIRTIPEKITPPRIVIPGLTASSEQVNEIPNLEFTQIYNSTSERGYKGTINEGAYYENLYHKKITGKLFTDIFNSYDAKVNTGFLAGDLVTDTAQIDTIFSVSATSNSKQSDELSIFRIEIEEARPQEPAWSVDYKEIDNGKYKFIVRSSGDIKVNSPPAINFNEKIVFSGSTISNSYLQKLITDVGLSLKTTEPCNTILPPTRFEVFRHILEPQVRRIFNFNQFSAVNAIKKINIESKAIIDLLAENSLNSKNFTDSKLLKTTVISEQYNSESSNTILLNLIDFSPAQTEEHKQCGIDTHLLQLEAVKKRIKQSFNTNPPENLINTNSRINTRYTDGKPGPLSKPIMTGLADTFIRASVIHNIFKGLFIFDQFDYNIAAFSYSNLIYLFIENRVKKDIDIHNLTQDFQQEYESIFNWYLNEQLVLNTDNESKFYKIVKYHVDSVLQFLNNLINGIAQDTSNNKVREAKQEPENTFIEANKKFLNSVALRNTYSNFFDIKEETYILKQPETGDQDRLVSTEPVYETANLAISRATNFSSNIDIVPLAFKKKIELEKYIYLNFKDVAPSNLAAPLKELFTQIKNEIFLNNVVNLDNFKELYVNLQTQYEQLQFINQNMLQNIILYTEEEDKKSLSWLKEKPKIGLRLVYKYDTIEEQQRVSRDSLKKTGFLKNYLFKKDGIVNMDNSIESTEVFENNQKYKIGGTQQIYTRNFDASRLSTQNSQDTRNRLSGAKIAKNFADLYIIPLVEKQIEPLEQEFFYLLQDVNLNNRFASTDSTAFDLNNTLDKLKEDLSEDPKLTLLVNYCLQTEVANTMALFNSLVGMNSEPMYKLFDKTKSIIKTNFAIHRDSAKFKNKPKNNQYLKHKQSKEQGPSTVDFLKAAATIPIGLLKGLSVAVDPNIFLADKIVLAGKMGFIQSKYKRFKQGERVPQIGTNIPFETSEGIAADGTYTLDNGIYKAKQDPQEGGNPLLDYTPVAQVKTVANKLILDKDNEGKVKIRYGSPFTGIYWNAEEDKALDTNFDENDISVLDIRPSLPIYPGENINIPYKAASLALAPFPIFTTTPLTTYNLAMPFGPIFLAFEDLLAQNPQFKLSSAKKADSPTDTGGNLLCDDVPPCAEE